MRDEEELRQQMVRRMNQAAERRAELEALAADDLMTTCDHCGDWIDAFQALGNGGWCDACAFGEGTGL